MEKWLIGAIVITVGVALVLLQGRSIKRRALRHMQGRRRLSGNEFGEQFFTSDRVAIATRLRQILSRHIELDLSQLYPDDKLVEDIRMDSLDSLSTIEFVADAETEFDISIPDSVAEQMRTLRDVVDYIAAHSPKATTYPSIREGRTRRALNRIIRLDQGGRQ